jgi:hypothetical protein
MNARRNARDYERLPQHSEAHLNWALITMMTRRLTRKSPAPASGPGSLQQPAPDQPEIARSSDGLADADGIAKKPSAARTATLHAERHGIERVRPGQVVAEHHTGQLGRPSARQGRSQQPGHHGDHDRDSERQPAESHENHRQPRRIHDEGPGQQPSWAACSVEERSEHRPAYGGRDRDARK